MLASFCLSCWGIIYNISGVKEILLFSCYPSKKKICLCDIAVLKATSGVVFYLSRSASIIETCEGNSALNCCQIICLFIIIPTGLQKLSTGTLTMSGLRKIQTQMYRLPLIQTRKCTNTLIQLLINVFSLNKS